MAATAESTQELTGTPLERVARIADAIREGGEKAQELRHAPQEAIDAMVDQGLFRFTIPRELGGENASVWETIEVIEAVSAIDGSIGWNLMLGSEINAMAAGGMDPDLAKEVYVDNPRVIMCGGGGPGSVPAKAVEQDDGGYLVSGQSTFISGCHGAEWCFMPAPVFKGDEMKLQDNGMPVFKMWILNKADFEILDTWDMAGLRGSGSHDVKAENIYVSPKWAAADLVSLPAHYENPVYRIPVPLRLAYNKAACALGVAKGALECFTEIAQNKVPLLSTSTLMNRPIAQHRMGESVAKYRAARAYLKEAMDAVEDELRGNDQLPGPETTQNARLACVYAANACMEVVDVIHNTAGTSGAKMASPLERKLRDSHGCASHRWVSHPLYGDLGAILLGNEPAPEFAGGDGMPMPK